MPAKSLLGRKEAIYRDRFGMPLAERVRGLLVAYPNVTAPNFLSWEGETLTGADTSDGLRRLLLALEGGYTF